MFRDQRLGESRQDVLEYLSSRVADECIFLADLLVDKAHLVMLREQGRKMLAAGVRVAVVTDFNPGSAPSYHLPLAMTLACLNQAMTPQESLMGATSVAAQALSMHGDRGSLRPGFRADLAIMDAPSLNHWLYHFVSNACVKVLKNGEWQA